MKAYGFHITAPVDCCPGHSSWACQSKHNHDGPRFDRDASRRIFKKRERLRVKRAIRRELEEV